MNRINNNLKNVFIIANFLSDFQPLIKKFNDKLL